MQTSAASHAASDASSLAIFASAPHFSPRSHIDEENGKSLRLVFQLLIRCRSSQQKHQIGVARARNENFLAVDDVPVSLADGACLDPRGFGSGIGFGNGEGLQAQLALGDRGQIAPLLLLASVTKQRAHGVHLGMTYGGVASRAIDLFQNNAGFRHPQARSSILFRYQSSEIPAFG